MRCRGILLKLSPRGTAIKFKRFEKNEKKFLTKANKFDILNKLFRKRRRSEKFEF